MARLGPMLLEPVLKTTIWGGRRLESLFGKSLPVGVKVGESWELADHPNGTSMVVSGPLAGRTLRDVVAAEAESIYGAQPAATWLRRFPLLVKIIDAADDLSIQVHPDDQQAAKMGLSDCGKTECWVILAADPGASLVVGVNDDVAAAEFRQWAAEGQLDPVLVRQEVHSGDFVFIPAGRLHAIGRGIVLAEFQQPSDTTFRVYDWNRRDKAGQARPLHLEEAMACMRFGREATDDARAAVVLQEPGVRVENLVRCEHFWLDRVKLDGHHLACETDRPPAEGKAEVAGFHCVFVAEGEGHVIWTGDSGAEESLAVNAGRTVLVPASTVEYTLSSRATMTALVAGVPRKRE